MKIDFMTIRQQLPDICKVSADFYLAPKCRGVNYFVKSPVTDDRTWSLCLYPSNNRFCDFANGNRNGDTIGLIAYVKDCNQWQALQILKDFYGLSGSSERNREEMQREIRLQQELERKAIERKKEFRTALWDCINDLQSWVHIYRTAIEKKLFEPFSDLWCFCMEELQRTECRLDILCAADCKTYPRLKANPELGLSSSRFQWILDSLAIMEECGRFKVTDAELEEIKAQINFELIRQPGVERRCKITW